MFLEGTMDSIIIIIIIKRTEKWHENDDSEYSYRKTHTHNTILHL